MKEVRSEISGVVFRIDRKTGDAVSPEDVLVTLECMKMELPVPSNEAGVIAEITVREGDFVAEGDLVAKLE